MREFLKEIRQQSGQVVCSTLCGFPAFNRLQNKLVVTATYFLDRSFAHYCNLLIFYFAQNSRVVCSIFLQMTVISETNSTSRYIFEQQNRPLNRPVNCDYYETAVILSFVSS